MSRIDEMIQRLCPDGVEYKKLGEAGTLTRGQRFTWKDVVSSGGPCLHYSEIYTHYGIWADTAKSYLPTATYEKLRKAAPGDVVIVSAGETVEDIGIGVAWLGDEPLAIHDACTAFHPGGDLDPKYASYFFRSDYYHAQIAKYVSSSKISSILPKNLAKAEIPVPPLEIQREIVRVLDSFAELEIELEIELEAELGARKAQYAHYRDELLSRESLEKMAGINVDCRALGEVGVLTRGQRFTWKDVVSGGKPCLHYSEVYTHYGVCSKEANSFLSDSVYAKLRKATPGDVVIVCSGETVEDIGIGVAWLGNEPIAIHDACTAFHPNAGLNSKYVSYCCRTSSYHHQLAKYVSSSKISSILPKNLAKVEVPVPPLAVQQQVVDILDRFDALTTSLTDGLPAEIEARRQQYEYYRDKLLDFPRKEA